MKKYNVGFRVPASDAPLVIVIAVEAKSSEEAVLYAYQCFWRMFSTGYLSQAELVLESVTEASA